MGAFCDIDIALMEYIWRQRVSYCAMLQKTG